MIEQTFDNITDDKRFSATYPHINHLPGSINIFKPYLQLQQKTTQIERRKKNFSDPLSCWWCYIDNEGLHSFNFYRFYWIGPRWSLEVKVIFNFSLKSSHRCFEIWYLKTQLTIKTTYILPVVHGAMGCGQKALN